MKVVLFCGGYGMRMLGWSGEGLPKPLQLVGDLPLVVHVMSHYAAYGHTDFVLCLGHAADQIQDAVSLVVANHPRARHWNVEYLDTGMDTPIGERLWLARHLVADEEMFFANYSDVLTDVSLDDMVAFGDGGNDVEMLKRAGTGIAMDNAPEAVKEISDGTTGSNNSQGVLAWLEDHLGLAN